MIGTKLLAYFLSRRLRSLTWTAVGTTLALVITLSGLAHGQSGLGSISGRVSDAKGAVVADAVVTITDVETKVKNTTKTNSSGQYTVLSLIPGTYSVEFIEKGFESLLTDSVIVSAAAEVQVNGVLKIGSDSQVITVSANSELLSTNSDVSTTVDREIVENLPYPERSSLEAILLVPGVTGDTLNPGGIQPENPNAFTNYFSPGASITIGGAPPGTSAIIIDGSDVTEASYPRAGMNLSGQVVQETTVVVAGASAKYGRTGGGVIVQATRSGTSQYHGGVTWRHTDPFFWAFTPGQSTKTDQHEQFYGVYLGGFVRIPKVYNGRDKTFFFAAYEPAIIHELQGAVRGTFLTPAELSGQFHNSEDILNQTVLKASGYAAALNVPRTGGIGYISSHGTTPSYTATTLFPNSLAYTSNSLYQQINGPLSDCTAAGIMQGDFTNPTVCHDDLSAILAANPFAQFVASQMPTPSNPGPYVHFDSPDGAAATDLTNGTYKRGVNNRDDRYTVRVDHQFNNNNQINVRYTNIPVNAARVFAVAADNPLNQTPTDVEHGYDISVGYTAVIHGFVNNAHYSWFRERLQRLPPLSTTSTDFGAKYGLVPAVLGYGFPGLGNFNSNGISYTIQPGGSGYSQQIDQNFIVGDDVTWNHGPHVFSVGFDYRWIQSNQYDLSGAAGGKYSFASANTAVSNGQPTAAASGGIPAQPAIGSGSAFATFLLGISSYSNTPVQVPGYYRYKYWAAYFQDAWRATPKLTFNLGLRYEVQVPRTEAKNNQGYVSDVSIPGTLNGIATSASFCFSSSCGLQRSLWPTNYFGLEPRVGFAYAPTSKTTIRGSYAITRPPLTGQENTPDINFNVSGSSAATTSTILTDYVSNPIAASSLVSAYTQLNGSRGPFNFSQGVAPVFVDQTTAVPNIQIYNLTVQYQPFSKTLVQASFQGVRGEHLYGQFLAKNTAPLGQIQAAIQSGAYLPATINNAYNILGNQAAGTGTIGLETGVQVLEPYQNFYNQTLNDIYPRNGDSHYNALYLNLNQRATRTVTLLANYTWSKSLDNVPDTNSGSGAGSGTSALQTPYSLNNEYSVSTFDQASAFKVGYNANLPFGPGQRFNVGNRLVNLLIGNFSTSGFVTSIVGFPNYIQLGNAGYFYGVQPKGMGALVNGKGPFTCPASTTTNYCVNTGSLLPSGYVLRPNRVPGVPLINPHWRDNPYNSLAPGGITPYLNAAAFSVPGSAGNPQIGNVPRTMSDARSPRNFYFDANVAKGFTIKDRYRIKLNVQLNNAFNHPSYYGVTGRTPFTTPVFNASASSLTGAINPSIVSSNFGTLGNAGAQVMSRVIRVGAEVKF